MIRELILRYPVIYKYFQIGYGMNKLRRILVRDFFTPKPGDRILDIGCGPADIINNFSKGVVYTGVDINERYLYYARKYFSKNDHVSFVKADVKMFLEQCQEKYNFILFIGSSQNFDDQMLTACYGYCHKLLKKGGKLIIMDGVYTEDTNWIERFFMKNNRGPHIRQLDGWKTLVNRHFSQTTYTVRKNLEHLPNCQVVIVAEK